MPTSDQKSKTTPPQPRDASAGEVHLDKETLKDLDDNGAENVRGGAADTVGLLEKTK